MAMRHFSDKDIDEIMADKAVANISGWTETDDAAECDENECRRRLAANKDAYMAKIREALDSLSRGR